MKRAAAVMAIAVGLLGAGGDTTTGAAAAPEGGLTATACNPGGKQVLIGGRSASVFCGPATATVKLGGTTLTFSKGTCVWTSNSFTLELGTIFLFWSKPFPLQPGFAIRAAGYPWPGRSSRSLAGRSEGDRTAELEPHRRHLRGKHTRRSTSHRDREMRMSTYIRHHRMEES